jgi:hypothetical protein
MEKLLSANTLVATVPDLIGVLGLPGLVSIGEINEVKVCKCHFIIPRMPL